MYSIQGIWLPPAYCCTQSGFTTTIEVRLVELMFAVRLPFTNGGAVWAWTVNASVVAGGREEPVTTAVGDGAPHPNCHIWTTG